MAGLTAVLPNHLPNGEGGNRTHDTTIFSRRFPLTRRRLGSVNRRTILIVGMVVLVLLGWRLLAHWAVTPEAQPQSPAIARREACLQRIATWEARKRAGELHSRHRPPSC
jgi:hypothetical protein